MKTIFGDELIGWTDFDNNQLLRCKKHKEYEGKLILEMDFNNSFLDIGSHYGDTVLTMALYAKKNKRNDIRFYAFEPNKEKSNHIKYISKLNNLNVQVFNMCVGNFNGKAKQDGVRPVNSGASSFTIDTNGDIEILKLDSIKDQIMPIGIMHIDTEGWETSVLNSSQNILKETNNSMYIIAEYWSEKVARKEKKVGRSKGIMSKTPSKELVNLLKNYNFERLNDLVDEERNLVFKYKL